ncbi:MAG: mucoidy inhibitor MuiA family protein [Proteobacteria bacterium]|nr:mucoidy inhibitor MuiA family protein [Pseudomonadota bacterium]
MTSIKMALGAGVAASVLAQPLYAAEIEARSRIDAVAVYPDAAIVTRTLDVDLPQGESVLVFRGLPLAIDPASLRVEGRATGGLTLGAVDSRLRPVDPQKVASETEAQLKPLREERERMTATIDALEGRKAMIKRFGQTGPARGDKDGGLEIAQWSAAWDAVGAGFAKVNDELRLARASLVEVDAKIKAIEAADTARRSRTAPEREFTVTLTADAPVKGALTVSYRVGNASWQPAYDARLTMGEAGRATGLTLVRRALVTQRTGEDWTGVTLSLSTVRAARGTQAPEVAPQRVGYLEAVVLGAPPMLADAPAPKTMMRAAEAPATGAAPPDVALKVAATVLETNGYQATFRIPGSLTVPTDGTQKSFIIQTRELQPDIVVKAAPALDPTAYLEASFANDADSPLLGGMVSLIRDGAFIGRGQVAFTPPGEKVALGFGADDRVTVTRVPVRRRETEPGLLGSNKTDTREFRISVKNLHDFPVKAVIVDQMPYSEAANLVVEPLSTNTPPTEKTVKDRRGVMSWIYDLKPKEGRDILLGYRLRWPSDRELTFERMPIPR